MKKRLKITMTLNVEDMTSAEQVEAGFGADEITTLDDYSAGEIGEVIAGLGEPDMASELFAGSMICAKFTGCKITYCEWEPDPKPVSDAERVAPDLEWLVRPDKILGGFANLYDPDKSPNEDGPCWPAHAMTPALALCAALLRALLARADHPNP